MKTNHPVTRAGLGIAALALIAILVNWLISLTPLGNRGIDFTENKTHTLSDGTRSILKELDTPVTLRYYASRNTDFMPEELKLHMRRVDDLLKEYSNLSKGKIRVENLDPEPDTDAEDSANLDGISGQRMDDQNLYFGIAISCLDRTSVIPFLNPQEETMLEYRLSKAIAEVTATSKPKVGLMTALDMKGGPAMMPGQPKNQGWMLYTQLKQSYDVVDLPMDGSPIDPKQIKVLLLFHPANITPLAEFAVDQYLLAGGTVIACLDAYSVAAQMTNPQSNMMMGGGNQNPVSSTLPTLLSSWGLNFDSTQVLADSSLATKFGDRLGLSVLTTTDKSLPQKDNVITKGVGSLTFLLPGVLTSSGGAGVSVNSLVRSSDLAGPVDAEKASQLDPSLTMSFRPTGKTYDLVTHLSGKFKTAFPNGKPNSEAAKPDAAGETKEAKDTKDDSLKEGSAAGNVFVISDIDAFYDRFAFNPQLLQMGMASPINGNFSLLLNILDQAVGSKYLIGSRSRAAIRRPFTVVQEMEAKFNQTVGSKIEEFEKKQTAAQEKLQELQSQKSNSNDLYLSPAQEEEIKNLRKEQVEYSKLIREQQKDLRRQKDKLAGNITLLNVFFMPALIILLGLGLFFKRRTATRAR